MAPPSGKHWAAVFARVRSALMRRGRSSHDADDLVQEAWVRLAIYEQNQVVERPDAFLMRIAQNLSVDAHRLSVSHGEEVAVEDVVLIDVAPSIDDVVLAKERMARLTICLRRLSPKTRDIFLSYRLEAMTYQEIAARHGLSVSTVEKHVARAMMQLADWMADW
jgi:RNA polymerase sigma factor (sigma-70 family)